MTTPRRSLTKLQLATAVGAELCQLLETATDDGRITLDEAQSMFTWLQTHEGDGLPAVTALLPLMRRVMEDGVIQPEELKLLQRELEACLPADLRREAVFARRQLSIREREAAREAQEKVRAEREEQRKEAALRRPADGLNFMVAGTRFEGRSTIIHQSLQTGDAVFLLREPFNKHDHNAVAVRIRSREHIGYVPRYDAEWLAPKLDHGWKFTAEVTTILTEGRAPIPIVQAYFYTPDAPVPEALSQTDVLRRLSDEVAAAPVPVPPKPAAQPLDDAPARAQIPRADDAASTRATFIFASFVFGFAGLLVLAALLAALIRRL